MQEEITITREQFLEFVRNENEDEENVSPKYYLKYFDNYKKTGKKASWNLAAFFFLELWSLHRKMYLYWVLISTVYLVQVVLLKIVGKEMLVAVLLLLPKLIFMRYANYIYLHYANKKIKSGTLKSGTNMWVIGFLFLIFLINLCIPEPIILIIKNKLLAVFCAG